MKTFTKWLFFPKKGVILSIDVEQAHSIFDK